MDANNQLLHSPQVMAVLGLFGFQDVNEGSVVWDAPSILQAAQATQTVTVTGAALGDIVVASAGISLAGLVLSGFVSAANTVTLVLSNQTGAAVDLASATYRVRAFKPLV